MVYTPGLSSPPSPSHKLSGLRPGGVAALARVYTPPLGSACAALARFYTPPLGSAWPAVSDRANHPYRATTM